MAGIVAGLAGTVGQPEPAGTDPVAAQAVWMPASWKLAAGTIEAGVGVVEVLVGVVGVVVVGALVLVVVEDDLWVVEG